ncbi:hypothetical protein BXZ70DRAFT_958574 [Cristinia sonorae]|uniref:SUZ domain-containing protein n=1 Tax=Cristinia sonorae TaxID=1940300 RepID=A0A8K0XKU6_9AGAR|nr:hypothetical protein BXZ70DRAFT_958574 [Cristinia sonorae]
MSVVNPSTAPVDSWDYTPSAILVSTRKADTVPDDWDAEEEEEEPQKLWENANKTAPMPELIISSTSTTSSVVPPPAAAFQPSLRILKRPSASPSPTPTAPSPNGTDAQQKSYAEREAQYQSARERIFGSSGESSMQSQTRTSFSERNRITTTRLPESSPPPITSNVIRNPRGPAEPTSQDTHRPRGPEGGGRGFANRRGNARKGPPA